MSQSALETLFNPILKISIAITVGIIIAFVINSLIKKWGRSFTLLNWTLELTPLKAPLLSLFPAFFALLSLPTLELQNPIKTVLSQSFRIWLILSFGWLIIRLTLVIVKMILRQYDITQADNLKARSVHTQIHVIHKILALFIVLITLALTLLTFDSVRQVGMSILASAGVMGIIIGFAAQKTLGNLLAGLQIALAQPIRLDDVVVVEGEWGRIEEITLTYVVIKIWDERRLVLPISYFTEKPFQNWTRTNAQILGSVFIYTDYQMPVEKIRSKLTELLENSSFWDHQVNSLQVTNTTEKTIEIRALMSAANSSLAWNLRCEIREKLIAFLKEEFPEYLPKTRIEMQSDNIEKS